jgi:hypothetical protein
MCKARMDDTIVGQSLKSGFHLLSLAAASECTLLCNLQSQARTHAVLVIGLYELLGNPTT